MGIEVAEGWATPCTSFEANTHVVGGTIVKDSYTLNLYERNCQVKNF